MKILVFHQNFPGQFKSLAPSLALRGHEVVCIGDEKNIGHRADKWPNFLKVLPYKTPMGAGKNTHHYLQHTEACIRRGQAVFRHLIALKKKGFVPDVCIGHTGWGESLYIKQVFPKTKIIGFFEFFYRAVGQDVGFDPEFPVEDDDYLKIPTRNAINYLSLDGVDHCLSPTHWQASSYPYEFRRKMSVIFDGVDTELLKPQSEIEVKFGDEVYKSGEKILTFVNRNLEPYRGYHVFVRALPDILKKSPDARVLIVGNDDVSYGKPNKDGVKWKDYFYNEIKELVPEERIRFTGRIDYADFIKVLQISTAHVYLTYPFVQSWSMLEAMAIGCNVIASDTPPCREFIRHGYNGQLFNFFDQKKLIAQVVDSLNNPDTYNDIRVRAREHVVTNYDLRNKCLSSQIDLIEKISTKSEIKKETLNKIFEIRVCAMAPDFMDVRIGQPYGVLSRLPGVHVEILNRRLDISPPRHRADHNILIVQRLIPQSKEYWRDFVAKANAFGWKVVSEWDDHPDKLPAGVRERFTDQSWTVFEDVDAIQTSTEYLADQFRSKNKNIQFFENCVKSTIPSVPVRHGPIKVFFGALNRMDDYRKMLQDINLIVDRFDCIFEVVHDQSFFDGIKVPESRKNFYGTLSYEKYLAILQTCDVALLPLKDTFANQCKSDLKFVEAASRGVVSICSPTVYANSVVDGVNGYIVRDEDWASVLSRCLANRNHLVPIAKNGLDYVARNRVEENLSEKRLSWYASL